MKGVSFRSLPGVRVRAEGGGRAYLGVVRLASEPRCNVSNDFGYDGVEEALHHRRGQNQHRLSPAPDARPVPGVEGADQLV